MMVGVLSFMALVSSLAGNTLVNYKVRNGFLVWIVSNVLWIAVNVVGELNVCQVLMFIVYMCLNVQGYVLWGRKEERLPER